MLLSHHLVPRSVEEIASTHALHHTLPARVAIEHAGHNESLNYLVVPIMTGALQGWYRYRYLRVDLVPIMTGAVQGWYRYRYRYLRVNRV
jgi:hypothetical protein